MGAILQWFKQFLIIMMCLDMTALGMICSLILHMDNQQFDHMNKKNKRTNNCVIMNNLKAIRSDCFAEITRKAHIT